MNISQFLNKCPDPLLRLINKIEPRLEEKIDTILIDRLLNNTDFSSLDVRNFPVCEIPVGEWDYQLFNVCFFVNMLKLIVLCLSRGYRPCITVKNSLEKDNLWEELFVQPYADIPMSDRLSIRCTKKTAPMYIPAFPTDEDIMKYGKLFQAFAIPNPTFAHYFEEEYHQLIEGKRVLGVLCRGTDYIATKPKNHPIQPAVEDVIQEVRIKIKELHCDAVYLATEEQRIKEKFEDAFPGMILENKRHYFDAYHEMHENNSSTLVSAVHFDRDHDSYYKALEYFSSLFLLSRCTGLIAGCCGGSRAALFLNYGRYEYSHLYNIGVYS